MTNEEAIKVLQTYDMSEDNEDKEFIDAVVMAIKALEQDQEPLTDVEQRIFLAAMCKEEKICKEICSDGEGVDLVAVCHSIERKVKKALWK